MIKLVNVWRLLSYENILGVIVFTFSIKFGMLILWFIGIDSQKWFIHVVLDKTVNIKN